MAAKSAMVNASGNTAHRVLQRKAGIKGAGSVDGIPPQREPMVSTGSETTTHARGAGVTPATETEILGYRRRTSTITRIVPRLTSCVRRSKVPIGGIQTLGRGSASRNAESLRKEQGDNADRQPSDQIFCQVLL